VIFTVFDIPPI